MFTSTMIPLDTSTVYEIRIREPLGEEKLIWFDEFIITQAETGESILTGPLIDQSALHGLLAKIRDLNLTLISVNPVVGFSDGATGAIAVT